MDILALFDYQAHWLNMIDAFFWVILIVVSLISVVKGIDHVKKSGAMCYYSIRFLLFLLAFYSIWMSVNLVFMGHWVSAMDVLFHGILSLLGAWIIWFHRIKMGHWRQNG